MVACGSVTMDGSSSTKSKKGCLAMSKISFLGIDFKPGSFDRYVAMDIDRQLYTYAINSQAGIQINHSHNIWSLRYNGEYTCQGRVSEVFKLPWELSLVSLKELTEPSDLDVTEDNVGDVFMCRNGSIATIQRIESTNPSKVHVEEVEIGRASCREGGESAVGRRASKET